MATRVSGRWNIRIWAPDDDERNSNYFQAQMTVVGTLENGTVVEMTVPNSFGEAATLGTAVRSSLNALSKSIGRSR
jgi:hypothetical protein